MIDQLLDVIHFDQWSWLVPWLFGFSIVAFLGSIVGVWVILIRLPVDYLTRDPECHAPESTWGVAVWLVRKIVLNLLGVGFLLAGIVMLLTPGQGILSIVVGVTLLDFPGKQNLTRRILTQPKVFQAINRLRQRAGKAPLARPPSEPA